MLSQELQIESPQSEVSQLHPNRASFAPHLTEMLEIKKAPTYFTGNATCLYSQRHNMIIVCPANGTAQFYDATTLLPLERRETLKFGNNITAISFWPETDVYMMGCFGGAIFAYNASSQTLKRVRSEKNATVLSIAYIDSQHYAFSLSGSQQIHVGSLEQKDLFSWSSQGCDSVFLYNLGKRNILLSGLVNGSVVIYRTDQLPKLRMICSHNLGQTKKKQTIKIACGRICNKEYIITYGSDGNIRIWNLIKGRMKLLRTIMVGETIHNLIYLEEHKLLVITYGMYPIFKFISLITGKLKSMFHLKIESQKFFLMKDRNTIGVVDRNKNRIQLVKLSSS